jgi:hypothetical protein
MEPKINKSYSLPEGFMDKYEQEVRKLGKMSDVMKAMYVRVGRERYDKLFRDLENMSNRDVHEI